MAGLDDKFTEMAFKKYFVWKFSQTREKKKSPKLQRNVKILSVPPLSHFATVNENAFTSLLVIAKIFPMVLASFKYLNTEYMTQEEINAHCEIKEYWWTQTTTTPQPKERVVNPQQMTERSWSFSRAQLMQVGVVWWKNCTHRGDCRTTHHTHSMLQWILERHKYMHHLRLIYSSCGTIHKSLVQGSSTELNRHSINIRGTTTSDPQNPRSAAPGEAAGTDPH